jgi:hypothetical protein
MWKQISLVVAVGCVGLAVACGPGNKNAVTDPLVLNQAETEASLVQNIFDVMTQLSTSVVFLSEPGFASDTVGAAIPTDCDEDDLDNSEDCGEGPSPVYASIAQGRDEVIEILETRVLTDSQLESAASALTLVYRMDPAFHCDDNEECLSLLTDHPIRVAIQSADKETFVVAIQVGAEQVIPVTFVVGPKELSVQVDFPKLADVIAMLNVTNDNGESKIPLPTVAKGLVRLAIQDLGGARAQVSLDVLEAIELAFSVGDDSIKLDVGAAELAMSADNDTQVIGALAYLGAVTLDVSGGLFENMFFGADCVAAAMVEEEMMESTCDDEMTPTLTEIVQLYVAGLSGTAVMDFKAESLTFTGLGLGPKTSTLRYGEETLVSVDINPDDGRVFDVALHDDGGNPLLSFSSIVDLGVDFNLFPIQGVLGEEAPAWALKDSLRAVLDSAKTPVLAIVDKAIQVVSGTLAMSSTNPAVEPLVIEAGSCVVPAEQEQGEPAPLSFIETLAVGMCPVD